ncbi:MAG TPA: NAD(P)-dependent oxidoreductase [Pseudolabrys sp.]|nr:NAD(P)-dependent oxidoreductase [Pseudolabrys sp.]
MKIGFIGCGHMGGAMAKRLIDNGYELVVLDRNPAVLKPLAEQGAIIAATPREVGDRAELVFACLPSREASVAVATGEDGIVAGKAVKIYVESSTLGQPTVDTIAARLASAGIAMADMPVSGGPKWAAEGRLTAILAAGPDVRAKLDPVLADLAKQVFVVGDKPGLAQVAKLVNNAISIAGMVVASEAIVMGVKGGVDADVLLDVINASTGRNSATVDKFPRAVLTRTFDYGGPLSIGTKDLELYLELGEALHYPTKVGARIAEIWEDAVKEGGAEQDYSEMARYFEKKAGVEVKGKSKRSS